MDLPELLEPERIRCHCDIHSKKRALQTVAELLGEALRSAAAAEGLAPDGHLGEAVESGAVHPETGTASRTGQGDGANADDTRDGSSGGSEKIERNARPGRGVKGGRGGRKGERGGRKGERGARKGAELEGDTADISDMDILDALISRERLGSTGLGHGVALPHSRLDFVDAPLAAMITLNEGVDFESGDGEPVDLVLGLLVPQDCNDEHLKILANLARRFNDAELRQSLREHESGEALFEHLQRLAPAS